MQSIKSGRLLSEFSTFGIGGPIRFFTEVKNEQQMGEALRAARQLQVPFLILGKGSNCLFSDSGFDGLVILNKIDQIEWGETKVRVGSGYSFSLLGVQTARRGWSGLEFASGIPATVGGALFMNAGAGGAAASECLEKVLFLNTAGERLIFEKKELSFGYRSSSFQNMQGVIVEASFLLQPSHQARTSQLQTIDYRLKTQPYKEKSAGCIFRNPEGASAGALIEKCGLKGLQIGGAKVSEKHANFIVNTGGAKASEVQELISLIQEKVKSQTGIHLEVEVRIL